MVISAKGKWQTQTQTLGGEVLVSRIAAQGKRKVVGFKKAGKKDRWFIIWTE